MSNNTCTIEELNELLETKQFPKLHSILAEANEMDIAAFMQQLSPTQQVTCFRTLSKEQASDVFSNLEPETQQLIISSITDQELRAIVEDLYVDDAVDMLEEMPAMVVKRVLKNAKPETRKLINQFLNYPEDSTGSIMTAEFIDLHKDMTVRQSIEHIRRVGEDTEQIYTCYVTNNQRILEGVVTVKELLLARDDTVIEALMSEAIITATTLEDQESAAQKMMKYDFIALPVVDQENRLVGIVTVDDVLDVIEDEATEDIEKMAAMTPSEHPYLKTSVFILAKNRIVWLLILMVSAMFTGGILNRFENAFVAVPLLVTCMPMLTDTGGNAGSQASTLIIRGMAVGEIQLRDWFRVLWKEARVSILCGVALSAVNAVRLLFLYPGQYGVVLTVSISLLLTVVMAKLVGGLLPMGARLIHVDPAIMAAPLITTIVDACALFLYFSIAQALLHI